MTQWQYQTPEGKAFTVEAPDADVAAKLIHEKLTTSFQDPRAVAQNIGAGMLRGMRDPVDAGAQLLTRGLEAAAPAGSHFENFMRGQRETVEAGNKQGEEEYSKRYGAQPGSYAGRVAGNVMLQTPMAIAMPGSTASLPARVASGTLSGAATGALQPIEGGGDFWNKKGQQVTAGAVGGGVASGVGDIAGRIVRPNITPEATRLMNEGVRPTPGQLMGGATNRLEQGLQSIPYFGDTIREARYRAVEDFNRAGINRALAPVGGNIDRNAPVGRAAIDDTHQQISDAYNALLPRLRVQFDPTFAQNFQNIFANARALEPAMADTFNRIMRDKVFHRISPAGGMTGNDFKTIESELGRLAGNYSSSADAGQRELGRALRQSQGELRELLVRSNPAQADELRQINNAFSHMVRLEDASGRQGSREGVFSPAQLSAAVRANDNSGRHSSYARGRARMQDLSDAGRSVLGDTVPDSGTPYRQLATALMGMGAGGTAGYFSPEEGLLPGIAGGAAIGGGVGGLYSRPGTAVARALLASRPPVISDLTRSLLRFPANAPFGAMMAQPSQ